MTWRDWRADTVVLAHGAESAPVLLTTTVATFQITRAFGHPLPNMTVVRVGKNVASVRQLLERAPRVGFFGSADFPDLLTYLEARDVARDLSFIGTSDAFLLEMGVDLLPEMMLHGADVEEDGEAHELASLMAHHGWEMLGPNVEAELRRGNFVCDPLPWAVRNDRVADYVRAITRALAT